MNVVHYFIISPLYRDGLGLPCRPYSFTLFTVPSPFPPLVPSHPLPVLPPRSRPLKYSRSVGSAVSPPVEFGAEPQRKSNLVHFSLKI